MKYWNEIACVSYNCKPPIEGGSVMAPRTPASPKDCQNKIVLWIQARSVSSSLHLQCRVYVWCLKLSLQAVLSSTSRTRSSWMLRTPSSWSRLLMCIKKWVDLLRFPPRHADTHIHTPSSSAHEGDTRTHPEQLTATVHSNGTRRLFAHQGHAHSHVCALRHCRIPAITPTHVHVKMNKPAASHCVVLGETNLLYVRETLCYMRARYTFMCVWGIPVRAKHTSVFLSESIKYPNTK